MREFLVAALLAVFAVVPCLGQDFDVVKVPDTLFMANGAEHYCLIKEMDNGSRYIKAKTLTRGFNKVVRLPLEKVVGVAFSDGLRIDVSKTGFDRSGLLAWPNKAARDKEVVVNKIITLTQPEVRAFYGDELFYGEYRPMRYQSIAGTVRFELGSAGILAAGVWSAITPAPRYGWGFLLGFNMRSSYRGDIEPGMITALTVSRGMMYVGLLDMVIANYKGRRIFKYRNSMEVLPKSVAWWEVAAGAGATIAGAWMMYDQWNTLDKYRGRFYSSSSSDAAFRREIVRAFTLSNIGSLVANLGLSAVIKGSSRLANFHPTGTGIVYNF